MDRKGLWSTLRCYHEEARLGVAVTWILAPLGGALACFYLGTIWATPSIIDLRAPDVAFGFKTGGLGLLGGILFALAVTFFYPPIVNRQRRLEDEAEAHH